MTEMKIPTPRGEMPAHLATPEGDGRWPGVVVIHDALGMSTDVRNQADWLASERYLAGAPNLYYWGRRIRCLISAGRLAERPLSELDASRRWLVDHEQAASGSPTSPPTSPRSPIGVTVGAGQVLPGATASSAYWAGKRRPTFGLLPRAAAERLRSAARARAVWAVFWSENALKAIRIAMLSNVRDMNVMTSGSLLLRLSHHRNGLSTQPPSDVPRLPS
jgi:hypothetical protein